LRQLFRALKFYISRNAIASANENKPDKLSPMNAICAVAQISNSNLAIRAVRD
jgi:hypothetical protein